MAPLYRIPDQHIDGFNLLIDLPEEKQKALLSLIQKLGIGQHAIQISREASSQLGINERNFNLIVSALAGLLFVNEETTEKLEEFAGGIAEAFASQSKRQDIDQKKLAKFIVELVKGAKNYKITLKADQLSYEREKILSRLRILTDVRPVFDDKDGKVIEGSVILHNLSIDYSENGESKRIVFAIDEQDINELQKMSQRALDKQATIAESLKGSRLRNISSK